VKLILLPKNPIIPCAEVTILRVLGDYLNVIENIPFLNSRVSREIKDMSCDIECVLFKRVKSSWDLAVQVDEATDIAGLSVFIAFVRYIHMYIKSS
jgi:hypothetical protein